MTALDQVSLLRPKTPKIPADAFTIKEYMERFGLTIGQARRELKNLEEAGQLKSVIPRGGGKTGYPERRYWLAANRKQ